MLIDKISPSKNLLQPQLILFDFFFGYNNFSVSEILYKYNGKL